MIISLSLPIAPVAWGRVKRGRFGQAYVPEKTRAFKRQVATLARAAHPGPPLTGPIGLEMTFVLPRPKRAPKRVVLPAVRPDLDNFQKAILDSLNGILFADDGQVCILAARKVYGRPSRIEVRAWAIGSMDAVTESESQHDV